MEKFFEGQNVALFIQGAGVTSKEENHVIDSIEDNTIYLEDSEKTFDLNGKCKEVDNFFGFKFWIK